MTNLYHAFWIKDSVSCFFFFWQHLNVVVGSNSHNQSSRLFIPLFSILFQFPFQHHHQLKRCVNIKKFNWHLNQTPWVCPVWISCISCHFTNSVNRTSNHPSGFKTFYTKAFVPHVQWWWGHYYYCYYYRMYLWGGGRLICSFNTFSLDADRLLPYCIFTPLKILIFLDTSQSYCKYCQRKSRFFIIQVCDTIHYWMITKFIVETHQKVVFSSENYTSLRNEVQD